MEKRVVLIYPYFYERDPVEKLFQPLGISYLASQLKGRGIQTDIVDCTFETFDEVVETVTLMNPAIIGISVMISFSKNAFDLAEALRSRLAQALFVAGGPLPTLYPEHFMNSFDVVFRGESDLIFPNFCCDYLEAMEKLQKLAYSTYSVDKNDKTQSIRPAVDFLYQLNSESYPGIYRLRSGMPEFSLPIHHSEEIVRGIPAPYRKGKQNALYQQFWRKNEDVKPALIMVTRGCPFACDFCSKPVWGDIFRKPSLEKVFEEIEEIIDLGYDQLWIADDSFTLDTQFLKAFCDEKISRGLKISWTCLSRTNGISGETVLLMKQAGCIKAYFGLESGSNEVLALMAKMTTVEDGIFAVHLFQSMGIKTGGFFIVGYPGETKETIQKTFDHALSLPLDEVFFNIPLPLPGSALFERVIGLEREQDWSKASDVKFVYESDFDEGWLKKEIKKTMTEFSLGKQKI